MLIEWNIRLLAGTRHDPEAGVYVAYTPALDIYSQGRTDKEAIDAVKSAILLFLQTHYRKSTLHVILSRAGFTPTVDQMPSPHPEDEYIKLREYPDRVDLQIPFSLVQKQVTSHQPTA